MDDLFFWIDLFAIDIIPYLLTFVFESEENENIKYKKD